MNEPELFILDVGHGNCAVLKDGNTVTVIDCPPGSTLIEVLDRLDIATIDQVLISHADVDHVGGLVTLLGTIKVRNVYINPDSDKKGKSKGRNWRAVRTAIELADRTGTNIHLSLTSLSSKRFISDQVEIEILAPSPGVALGGVGGEDLAGRRLTSNSMSVVVGIIHKSHRVVLLPGDMDEVGLLNLTDRYVDIQSKILVFPHHGGTPGSKDIEQFAKKLCDLVNPDLVLFSLDRSRFKNPKQEIIQGVRTSIPRTHIMCTQLSKQCSSTNPLSGFIHLSNLPAKGRETDSCCGGTILITINGEKTTYTPSSFSHKKFVTEKQNVLIPMCL